MTPPKASDQKSLAVVGYWAGSANEIMTIDDSRAAIVAVRVVDKAILKMMENGDECE